MLSLRRAALLPFVLCLAVTVVAPLATAAPASRVLNGRPAVASEPGTMSIVAVGRAGAASAYDSFQCGGTIIAPKLVVTARHCVDASPFISDARRIVVFRGTGPNLALPRRGWSGVHTSGVASIHRSPGAGATSFDRGGDIALLRLATDLPETEPMPYVHEGDDAWFAPRVTGVSLLGWGATIDHDPRTGAAPGGYPTQLQAAMLPIVPQSTCLRTAKFPDIASNYLCAGVVGSPAAARTSCYGDSGGPLFASDPAPVPGTDAATHRLVGIVSHGDDDRCGAAYTRYTRVDRWAAWLDAFVAAEQGVPSGTAAPKLATVRRAGPRRLQIVPAPTTTGPAPRRLLVTLGNPGGSQLLEQGTIGPRGGTLAVPPTRSGRLLVSLRALDAAGNESAASTSVAVVADRDRTPPRIARASAKSLGNGRWQLDWSRPSDDDRVVTVVVERRRPGAARWQPEHVYTCMPCWTRHNARITTTGRHWKLPGRWQFRFTPYDRAGNKGVPTLAR